MTLVDRIRFPALTWALSLPDAAVRPLVRVPATIDGQAVDLRMRWFLTLLKLDHVDHHLLSVEAQREEYEVVERMLQKDPVGATIQATTVRLADRDLAARVYRPESLDPGPRPGLLYLHGGGFVLGHPAIYDGFCSRLAVEADCVVVSLDYRLAPEHPFPAALDDALDGFRWLRKNARSLGADPERLGIGGDSAGGNLSAVVANSLPAAEAPALQLLLYPGVHFGAQPESMRIFGSGFYMSAAHVEWFYSTYAPDRSLWTDPRCSPCLHPEPGHVPAVIMLCGFDTLRDEGRAYAAKLSAAGVPVDLCEIEAMVHGFATIDRYLPAADFAVAETCRRFRHRINDRRPPRSDP